MCHDLVSTCVSFQQAISSQPSAFSYFFFFGADFFAAGFFAAAFFLRRSFRSFGFSLRGDLYRLCRRLHFLRFRFLLRKLGSSDLLAINRNLRNTHRSERLSMAGDLLVLFLPFVVERSDFVAASLFDYGPENPGIRWRPP